MPNSVEQLFKRDQAELLATITSLRQANLILWQQVAEVAGVPFKSDKVGMLRRALERGIDRGIILQIADNDEQIAQALKGLADA